MMNSYPKLPLEDQLAETITDFAKDWALSHGLTMRESSSKKKSDVGQIAPFTLLPTPLPHKLWKLGMDVQKAMNLMYFHAAMDFEFISSSLESVIKTDEFVRNMLHIYEEVMKEGIAQSVVVQIQRSDYMCHVPRNSEENPDKHHLKQIEVNNIASSFPALADRCTELHKNVLCQIGLNHLTSRLPANEALNTVAMGLVEAWKSYSNPKAVILVVVEELNQNISDQRLIETAVLEKTQLKARSVRLTLTECGEKVELEEKTKKLFVVTIRGKEEVSVVYFRAGYVPTHYHGKRDWATRLRIERSAAIKTPWIGLHLANSKKIQQVLADPGMVEKYLPNDPGSADLVRSTFAGLWGLESSKAQSTNLLKEKLMDNPQAYVLKPQLEGGGNNTYGGDIPGLLKKLSPSELDAYIAMERIFPAEHSNYLIRAGMPLKVVDTVSELGVYGYLLGDIKKREVIKNVAGGHLMRTKAIGVDEGGIMAGASALDSPFLI